MQQEAMFCQTCQLQCKYPSQYKLHIESKSHKQKENPQPKTIRTYGCHTCNVIFQSHKDELRHLATKKHNQCSKTPLDELFCQTCQLQCKYPSHYKAHIESRAHKEKESPELKPNLKCDDCGVRFRSYKEQTRHLATKKHAKMSKTDSLSATKSNFPTR